MLRISFKGRNLLHNCLVTMYFKGEVNQKTLLHRKSVGFDLVCTAESSKVLRCAVYQLPASPVEMARAELFLENTLCHPEY